MQSTKFENLLKSLVKSFEYSFGGSWRRKSFLFLSLLVGYFVGINIRSLIFDQSLQRSYEVLILVAIIELLIRIRSLCLKSRKGLMVTFCFDNLRIGFVYAVVLEAFKLGS